MSGTAQTNQGNLTNTPPHAYVKNQIELRQQLLGRQNYANNPEILQLYNNRGVFARICSSIQFDEGLENDLLRQQRRIEIQSPDVRTSQQKNDLQTIEYNLNSTAKKRLLRSGFNESFISDIKGRNFSKKFIIQGSVIKNPFENPSNPLLGGLLEGEGVDKVFGGLYGWGSITDNKEGFGYAPPPGITSATVKYLNKGAVTECTINVKLYNKRQFQLFDLLYLRPGFSLLFEFGWTQYIKSGRQEYEVGGSAVDITAPTKIENADFNTPAFQEFFKDKPDKEKIFTNLEVQRALTEGNYDGVFGIISNFDWTFNEDGTYDCTIKMFGHGGVIDGLTANSQGIEDLKVVQQIKYVTETQENEEGVTTTTTRREKVEFKIPDADRSALGKELYSIINRYKFIQNWNGSGYGQFKFKTFYLENFKDRNGQSTNLYFPNGILGVELTKSDGSSAFGDEADKYVQNPISYMLLGAFFAMLQSKYLLYAYEGDEDTNPEPITSFDFNFVEKDIDGRIIVNDATKITGDGTEGSLEGVQYIPDNLENDQNFMLTAPGVFSADPSVCLVNWQNVTQEIAEITDRKSGKNGGIDVGGGITINDVLSGIRNTGADYANGNSIYEKTNGRARSFPNFSNTFQYVESGSLVTRQIGDTFDPKVVTTVPTNAFLGQISNIYVNINMLIKLAGQAADGQKLFMGDFLNNLLQEIQSAFGGINQLRTETRETGVITIRDLMPNIGSDSVQVKDKKPTLNVFGIDKNNVEGGSFVKKFNINGSIPKDMMTQIIVGATATGNSVTSNSTGLAGYNRGLMDVFKENVKSGLESVKNEDDTLKGIFRSQVYESYRDVYNTREWTSENLNTLKQGAKTFFPLLLGAYSRRNLVSSTFLPFDMSVEIDGLGGFVVFNAIRVKENVLPVSYNDQGTSLMLSAMDQQIDDSGWKTTLSCITFSDPPLILGDGFIYDELTAEEIQEWYDLNWNEFFDKTLDEFEPSDTCKGKEFTGLTIAMGKNWDTDQRENAKTIFQICKDFGITNTMVIGGIMRTAWGEASLRNKRENAVYYDSPSWEYNGFTKGFRLQYSKNWMNGQDWDNYNKFHKVWGPPGPGGGFMGKLLGDAWSKEYMTELFNDMINKIHSIYNGEVAYLSKPQVGVRPGLLGKKPVAGSDDAVRLAAAYWFNYIYGTKSNLGFSVPSTIEEQLDPNRLLDINGSGNKYRGAGAIQLTGPDDLRDIAILLHYVGIISKEYAPRKLKIKEYSYGGTNDTAKFPNGLLAEYPNLTSDEGKRYGETLESLRAQGENLPGDPFMGHSHRYMINAIQVVGMLEKITKQHNIVFTPDKGFTVDGTCSSTRIQSGEDFLNMVNCIDDEWVAGYFSAWGNTGWGDNAGEKKDVYEGKRIKFEVDDLNTLSYDQSGVLTII